MATTRPPPPLPPDAPSGHDAAADAGAEMARLRGDLAALQASHQALLGSYSWRLTAPLRDGARWLYRLLPHVCERSFRWLRRAPVIGPWLIHTALVRRHAMIHGAAPRLDPPITFNEHILHRILFDRDPRLKVLNDKLAVRDFIRARVGEAYVVPLLGVWSDPALVDWDQLRVPFVLKPNHSSGPIAYVRTEADLDRVRLTALARGWLAVDYFDTSMEWGYRNLPRRLLAEPLLRGPDGAALVEALVFTFHGRAAIVRVFVGVKGSDDRREASFDAQGVLLPKMTSVPQSDVRIERDLFDRLTALAETLSAGFSQLRVDFHLTADGPMVCELTTYTGAGTMSWSHPEWDGVLGRMWAEQEPQQGGISIGWDVPFSVETR
jgi:TupA-like ATPgrasp